MENMNGDWWDYNQSKYRLHLTNQTNVLMSGSQMGLREYPESMLYVLISPLSMPNNSHYNYCMYST